MISELNQHVESLSVEPPLAFLEWRTSECTKTLPLASGRYLIGDTSLADIQIAGQRNCMYLKIDVCAQHIELKCLGPKLPVQIDGRRLEAGEIFLLGDVVEFRVGMDHFKLRSASLNDEVSPTARSIKLKGAARTYKIEDHDELKKDFSRILVDQLNLDKVNLDQLQSESMRTSIRLRLRKLIQDTLFDAALATKSALEKETFDEVVGLGPLEPLLDDNTISEIMVNRRDQIYIERGGRLKLTTTRFSSDHALLNVIERIVATIGRRIDKSSPIVDARLIDGSRVNAVIPPLAIKGPTLTIRKFSRTPISARKLIEWNSVSAPMVATLELLVLNHKNLIISGGTGSGKTTLLNALSSFIPGTERIITVEDAAELQLQQSHVISLETRPANLEGKGAVSIRDLVKNTLRMRPDRIIVGECRGGEALDMLQAMNTGHDGSMTTAHANSPQDMLRRIETMVLLAGVELPLLAIRQQVVSALTVIVQQARKKNGLRLVTHVSWVKGLSSQNMDYVVLDLFSRNEHNEITPHHDNLKEFCKKEEIDFDLIEACFKKTLEDF